MTSPIKMLLISGLFLVLALTLACGGSNTESYADVGKNLYAQNCQSCHGDAKSGEGALPDVPNHGPDGHTWHHADGQLVDIILGRLNTPSRTMPSFGGTLTDEEAMAILDYFKTGWPEESRQFQQEASKNWDELYPKN
jgi:mono/diheme cytochrome c family protein